MTVRTSRWGRIIAITLGVIGIVLTAAQVQAQIPPAIQAELRKIGPIVDPACTAKLYRPLMPQNDYNTYWPAGAPAPVTLSSPLYPGVNLDRDLSFGPHPKDLIDVFSPDKSGGNRTVLVFIPGGEGNKIAQQTRETNAFYDNIGRWAARNNMVGVTMQRHPGARWDDPAKDISTLVQWLQSNVAKYGGDPDRIFLWAHSAGNAPLGTYIGHPEVHGPKGAGVKGVIFMSGNPVPDILPTAPAAGGGNPFAGAGSTCNESGPTSTSGAISGPSGVSQSPASNTAPQAGPSNLPGFKSTTAAILIVRAELDPDVDGKMAPSDIALYEELCKLEGPKAKAGVGRCPTMYLAKGHSHMSEVFSIDTDDQTVGGALIAWMKRIK